jgi:hypothetical protein
VAAGIEPLIDVALRVHADHDVEAGIRAGLGTFRERITHLEDVLLAHGESGPLATEEAERLRERVHNPEKVAVVAALRKRRQAFTASSNGDGEAEEAEAAEDKGDYAGRIARAKLRQRVRGNGVKASVGQNGESPF